MPRPSVPALLGRATYETAERVPAHFVEKSNNATPPLQRPADHWTNAMFLFTRRRQRHDEPAPQEQVQQHDVAVTTIDTGLRLLMIVLLLSLAVTADAPAHDYGQYGNTDPAIKDWIKKLTDKSGQGCCATADGHPAVYEWDTAGNHYKVRIEGQWYDVPPEAVVDGPNKLGYATVWYWWDWSADGKKTNHIRCFLPGPGG